MGKESGLTQSGKMGTGGGLWSLVSKTMFPYDPDAKAFMIATGIADNGTIYYPATPFEITGNALWLAVNQLYLDLKAALVYTKIKAMYPFVGGTAATHKLNGINPADSDAAFRLLFSGGNTHSGGGWQPNAINGFASSFWIPNDQASINGFSFGIYSRTNSLAPVNIYGCSDFYTPMAQHNMFGANMYVGGDVSTGYFIYMPGTTQKMFVARRNANNDMQGYQDGVSLGTNTSVQVGVPSFDFTFGTRNDAGSVGLFMDIEHAFAFLGLGLTNQNALDLTTCVNTFETSLFRNV